MPTVNIELEFGEDSYVDFKRQWNDGCQIILAPENAKCFNDHLPIVVDCMTVEE